MAELNSFQQDRFLRGKQERIDAKKRNEERNEARRKEAERLLKDYAEIFTDPRGQRILADIMNISGYFKSPVDMSGTTGEIVTTNTLYNEGMRMVYAKIRNKVPKEILAEVELDLDR